jgi:hypothetical protein
MSLSSKLLRADLLLIDDWGMETLSRPEDGSALGLPDLAENEEMKTDKVNGLSNLLTYLIASHKLSNLTADRAEFVQEKKKEKAKPAEAATEAATEAGAAEGEPAETPSESPAPETVPAAEPPPTAEPAAE